MKTAAKTVEESIRQVARGERPWTDLRSFGMELQSEAGRADRVTPTDVRITAHDLALGFLSSLDDPAILREWAFVMEAVDADFEAVESHPDGEVLLTALRNTSFGEPLDEREITIIRTLARESEA